MVISDIHHSAVSRKLIDESRHFVILCTRAIFNITAVKKASFFNLHESTTKKDHLNTVSMRKCFGSGLPFWEIFVENLALTHLVMSFPIRKLLRSQIVDAPKR